MQFFYLLVFLLIANVTLYSQVGIGTNTPNSSSMLEVESTSKGFLLPRMSSSQRTSIASPATGLQVYDNNTNSIWYYNGTIWINTLSMASMGDIKSGIQNADHGGWVLLDGRAINTLSTTQQAAATALGLAGNIPNASNAYLVQNGGTLASVTGSNTVTLTQANLPSVNFTGTAASAGDHSHSTDPTWFSSDVAGWHDHWVDPPNTSTTTNGWHNHGSNATGANIGLALINGWGTPSGIDYSWNEINNYATIALDIYGSGNHTHTVDISGFWASGNGNHSHTIDVPATTSSTNGAHTHSVSVASGGSATPVNIAPRSMTVNMFIYLGF